MFENHPPKELTSCHLKPAHCFYSMQMFSSILSLIFPSSLPPSLPSLHPHPLFLTFYGVCVWMDKNGHRWSVHSHSSLPLDFCCISFRCQKVFDISTVSHFLLSIASEASSYYIDARGPARTSSSIIHVGLVSLKTKCMWFFYILMFCLCFVPLELIFNPLRRFMPTCFRTLSALRLAHFLF